MYPANVKKTRRDLGTKIFAGKGRLEEMECMSRKSLSGLTDPDSRVPIRILIRDKGKLYALFFVQSRYRSRIADEREKNIEELVRAHNQGARILVTGVKQRKEYLEESTIPSEPREIITDCSLKYGIIRVIQPGKLQEYTYKISEYKDDTILAKGDWILPMMKE